MLHENYGLMFYIEVEDIDNVVDIVNILRRLKAPLVSLQIFRYDKYLSGILITNATSTLQPKIALEGISKVKGVKRVEIIGKIPEKAVRPMLSLAIKEIIKKLDIAGKVFAFHFGLIVGSELVEILTSYSAEETIEKAFLFIKGNGLGIPSLIEHIPNVRCIVKVERLFECMGVTAKEPNSHFFRGFLSGVLSKLWGTNVRVLEIRCVALGDKHCEFIATPAPPTTIGL